MSEQFLRHGGPVDSPNEAYEVVPMKEEPHGPPPTWWTVTCNGIPVHHFAPGAKHLAEKYATDPEYRKSLIKRKLHDKKP